MVREVDLALSHRLVSIETGDQGPQEDRVTGLVHFHPVSGVLEIIDPGLQ